ncbi:protein kinase domain-containing protein [Planctomicrobium piriforme]|uniref:non-specific serine/threonine protein kinase n=1 Tax=Planctomicrobium piriforme TaxID=1576369 RepID=A0A1I3NIR8_9PLAN|nr:protein kinase [Planctomicrobium piriforme]SFJ08646.1 serine/threonine protein kinase [Planctomicrobium piriforme]
MTSPQSQPTSNTRWIWPFEILEQIGEGGMGVVYRARYVVNGRQVALKMVPTDVADKTALARFERELEVLKTLRHPNIVRCFGGVCEDKRRFYAMELLEGGSLEDQLQAKGKLAWEQVIYYGLQMCAALECSHEKGVVHRDVKPSNFLLTPSGQLKLSDFGLASVMAARKITAAGKTAGTFLYMAPEQIRGQDVTPRTDLYALGCVLFELVTGEVPFIGETPGATLHLHCYAPPPRPTEKALDCPVLLERTILKLLEKDPAQRYESAATVARDLRAVNQTVTVSPRSEKGMNYPTGYKSTLVEEPVLQKKTAELPVRLELTPSKKALTILAGVLAVSLLCNVLQLLQEDTDSGWKEMWTQALTHPRDEVRIAALESYGQMARRNPESLEVLTKYADDPHPPLRAAAVRGLGTAGPTAASRLPILVRLEKSDADEGVRNAARTSIEQIRAGEQAQSFPWIKLGLASLLLIGTVAGIYVWLQSRDEPTHAGTV